MKRLKSNDIWSDGVCVYIVSEVTNPFFGKIVLLFADIIILSATFIAIKFWIPGLLIMSAIFLFFLFRYTLWNFFGKENIIINTKSFGYQHEYGFFKKPYIILPLDSKIIANAHKINNNPDDKHLKISFISYREVNNIPYEVYTMSFPFTDVEVIYLISLIQQLYVDKLSEENEFPIINLN